MTVVNTSNIHEISAAGGGLRIANASTEKLGFYGLATPIVRPSGSSQAAVTITATTAIGTTTLSQVATSGKWAFASSTAGNALVTRCDQMQVDVEALGVLVNKLRADLVALNLLAGA